VLETRDDMMKPGHQPGFFLSENEPM